VQTYEQNVAPAAVRTRKLGAQARLAIQRARQAMIRAKHLVNVTRSIRYTAKTLRKHHLLPR